MKNIQQTGRKLPVVLALFVALFVLQSTPAAAQPVSPQAGITGDWQGTLEFPAAAGRPASRYRLVLRVTRAADGHLTALNYSIDQTPTPMQTADVTLQGNTFRFAIPALGGTYTGQLSADGASITGTWTQRSPLPLNFVRATPSTAWQIPEAPAPPKPMAADADATFAAATISRSDPTSSTSTKIIRVMGRQYITQNTSLADLIQLAYGLHARQIVGAPAWVFEDKFDLTAVPDGEGQPNGKQWLTMMQKLLADRFHLAFHHDKREIPVYALSVAPGGLKGFDKSESAGGPIGLEFVPSSAGLTLPARNTTLAQFCQMMQQVVLDRPVLDQTGTPGQFNFHFTFTPDDFQFNGHPPRIPSSASPVEAAPGLFEALQQQLGLKLTPQKAPVEVLAIDHVEKPSPN